MTTQDTNIEDSLSHTTITFAINDTGTATASDNNVTTVNIIAAAVAPTYAVIAKRTDNTTIPTAVQPVIYDRVTGDINKVDY